MLFRSHSGVAMLTIDVERGAALVLVMPVRTCEKRRMDNIRVYHESRNTAPLTLGFLRTGLMTQQE